MASRKIEYGASTSITATSLASVASGSAASGAAVDNSTNKYLDAVLSGAIALAAGTPSGDKCINIWIYGSEDGTNFGDNAAGTDAAVTMRSPSNLRGPFVLSTPDAGGLTYKIPPLSVAAFFGGLGLPRKWGVVVENKSGVALAASGSSLTYSGVYETIA
jgi:hypothetical protein